MSDRNDRPEGDLREYEEVHEDNPNLQAGVFVGIDWGGQHHQLCVLDDSGNRRLETRIDHDVAGLCGRDTTLA